MIRRFGGSVILHLNSAMWWRDIPAGDRERESEGGKVAGGMSAAISSDQHCAEVTTGRRVERVSVLS